MENPAAGSDSDGRSYESRGEMWAAELATERGDAWYSKALAYWAAVPASVDGVLGGYGRVSPADVKDSDAFLRSIAAGTLRAAQAGEREFVAADCGAGVGRVTAQLLLRHCTQVHVVEPVGHFLDAARSLLAPLAAAAGRAVTFVGEPLQSWAPTPGGFDLIWAQWVLGHLTDDDLVAFFRRCAVGLAPGGWLVVKENNTASGFLVDKDDSSVTRSHDCWLELFARAGMEVHATAVQTKFPRELFTVRMYALRPQGAGGDAGT